MDSTPTIAGKISEIRTDIKSVGEKTKKIIDEIKAVTFPQGTDVGEMIANAMLAYRHLEDAAMRLGKTIQAYEGGKSIYDDNDAKRVAQNGPVDAGSYSQDNQI